MEMTDKRDSRKQERKISESLDLTATMKTTLMGSMHSMAANAIQNLKIKQRLVALPKGKEPWESFRGTLR